MKACKEEKVLIEQYQTDNAGYYLYGNSNKTKCLSSNKINKNCLECNDENNNIICNKSPKVYELINDLCIEIECQ